MKIKIEGGDNSDSTVPIKMLLGKREIIDKLASVVSALCEADLIEEVRMFHDRIIVPALGDFNKVIEYEEIRKNVFTCQFKPMIELVLDEMKSIAEAPGFTTQMRKEGIAEALTLAGF